MKDKIFDSLNEALGNKVRRDVILAPYTSFGIGGPARYFITAKRLTEIIMAVRLSRRQGIKHFILGGGSNILFDDAGYDGLIIKDECQRFHFEGTIVAAQSGAIVDQMVDKATELGLSGMEYAAGIRGTIGGAVYGNAGAFGHAINEILQSAVLYTGDDKIKIVDTNHFKFAYRKSSISESGDTVISVRLALRPDDKERIAAIVDERRQFRKDRHPVGYGSAGSVFKNLRTLENPNDVTPAGKLLEQAGLRGMRVGGAAIFEKHCNIVINTGGAKSSDVKSLVEIMKKTVKDKFGIDLHREILYIEP